jgi:hypothetical protein
MSLPQLRRVRWAVRATLLLGVAASVAANILHAEPNPVSQVIAAWPPLALLLTVELISRVPVHRRSLAIVRLAATTTIAGIAAWVSYWHMAGVASRYGETGASPYLLPLSVDGLVIVASVSLVELAGRIRLAETAAADAAEAMAAAAARAAEALATRAAEQAAAEPVAAEALAAQPAPALGANGATVVAIDGSTAVTVDDSPAGPAGTVGTAGTGAARPKRTQPRRTNPSRDEEPPARKAAKATPVKGAATTARGTATVRPRRPVAETAKLAAQMEAEKPHMTPDDVAAVLGITTQRLRRIKREVGPELEPVG